MLKLVTVMVLIGVISAISGVYMAPMVQSYSSGRRMLRTANSSRFGMDRISQLLSRARADSIVLTGSDHIYFSVHTGPSMAQSMRLLHNPSQNSILLDGEPLLRDVDAFTVAYTNGVIFTRIFFGAAPNTPVDLAVYPRN